MEAVCPRVVHYQVDRLRLEEERVSVVVLLLAGEVQEAHIDIADLHRAHEDSVGHVDAALLELSRPNALHQGGFTASAVTNHKHLTATNNLEAALLQNLCKR